MDQDHQERIRQRAHEIWESEGRPEGREADHWAKAEEELRNRMGDGQQTDASAKPQLARTAKPKTPRKSKKADQSESTPYLNDGP